MLTGKERIAATHTYTKHIHIQTHTHNTYLHQTRYIRK